MRRGKPLKRTQIRRTRMRRGPSKRPSKYARRERDFDYMMFVKTLPCLIAGLEGAGPCSAVVEADHAGIRGIGQKAPDRTCVPLCSAHHLDRGAHTGYFRNRTKEWAREWRAAAIVKTQLTHAERTEGLPFPGLVF